jgi:hypothetical protein
MKWDAATVSRYSKGLKLSELLNHKHRRRMDFKLLLIHF